MLHILILMYLYFELVFSNRSTYMLILATKNGLTLVISVSWNKTKGSNSDRLKGVFFK